LVGSEVRVALQAGPASASAAAGDRPAAISSEALARARRSLIEGFANTEPDAREVR
jgi:hypothetical protein